MELLEDNITGTDVAGLFDNRDQETLTGEERIILAALLSSSDRVDMAIPEEIDPKELWRTLGICSRVFVRVRRANVALKILIGRAIILIQKKPEIYESRGFKTFDDFMSFPNGLQSITGISRAELFKAKSTAASLGPTINMEDVRQAGITKITMIAGVTDPGTATQKALIEAAKTDTVQQLKERIARSGMQLQVGDLSLETLQVMVTTTQKKFIQDFLNNARVRAYVGSDSQGVILERLVQECESEWLIQATGA